MKCLIPQDIDEEAVKALVDTKVLKPQRGEKKQLVNLAIKNARVSLEQKFNLLEKSVEKTQGAIENLRTTSTNSDPSPHRVL